MPIRVLFIGVGALMAVGLATPARPTNYFETDQRPAWTLGVLPGSHVDVSLQVLKRSALSFPARYSVVVVPGSGCTGWRPVAERYFSGLLHAELLVLHKPGVHVDAGLAQICSSDFVRMDALSTWRDHAKSALRAYFAGSKSVGSFDPKLPILLVGISEGAELLPDLATDIPHLAGLVLISAPGLDPVETGELQARRLGQSAAWLALKHTQNSHVSDDTLYQGRTVRYWRDFWHWKLAQPLLDAPWPLLRVWGGDDTLVPETAYQTFTDKSRTRSAPTCQLRLPGADHGLQSNTLDGLQWLWSRIEAWARHSEDILCERVLP